MIKIDSSILALTMAVAFVAGSSPASDNADKEHAELAKALAGAKVTLEAGLKTATSSGKAISAKYELEDGRLQLSVYTEKDGKFSEVVVNHNTGKVAKSEVITEGEDLAAAKSQSEAMTKAKLSLDAAGAKALSANAGFRAVSVTPSLKDGHPVADVALAKGAEWKSAAIKLD